MKIMTCLCLETFGSDWHSPVARHWYEADGHRLPWGLANDTLKPVSSP